jgi:hypothetical protein
MVLDAIATVILAGLMLIPIVNVVVGGVGGAGLFGPPGAIAGVLLAIGITWLEVWLADAFGWRDLHLETAAPPERFNDGPATERTIKTGPPSRRRQSRHSHESKPVRRATHVSKVQRGAAL